MRPRNLKLQGFGCFRAPVEIDFSNMDVFVVSGPTGAGKTTLIDAICYALYGKVPRETTPKDLIARDASEMKVQLEFEAGGRMFRVHRGFNVRRTTNRKTGAEKLERDISPVQFEEYIDGEWQPIADRVDDIGRYIEECVGLDFASFTKCVLLPQGRFAEFLAGEPKERRRILVDLLEIGVYARIMQRANKIADDLKAQERALERRLREDYADATEEALERTRAALERTRPELETARARRDETQRAHEFASTVLAARKRERDRKDQVQQKQAELETARAAAQEGDGRLSELSSAVAEAEKELTRSPYEAALHAALVRAHSCAEQLARSREAFATADAAAKDRTALDRATAAQQQTEARQTDAQSSVSAAEAALEVARRDDAAAHVRGALKPGDPCPVCGGVVGKLPKAGKSRVTAAEKELQGAKTAEAAAANAASDAGRAAARAQQAFEQAAKHAEQAEAEVARAERELTEAVPAGIQPALKEIAAKLNEQESARRAHERLSKTLDAARRALDDQRQQMATSGQTIAAIESAIAQLNAAMSADRAEGDAALVEVKAIATRWQWGDVIDRIEAAKSPVEMLGAMLQDAQSEAERLTGDITRLEESARRITEAMERVGALRDELAALNQRWQVCRDLGVLLRADNFQEFVIVEAMQVLAASATEHLRTLYDRFAIGVDGSEFVVIDHWHAGQVRPAKTLSGGETFVASLALALALSERLPELRSAAAATLESLFLDEGFGTLDAETLDTVIDALEGLRSRDRMVGVITHVPELTQRIEQRILVRKSPAGSSVEVEGAA